MAANIQLPSRSNASANVALMEQNNIERFGAYTRLYIEDRCYTNIEELQYAGRLASILIDRGVRPGDRVMVVFPNTPELTASLQAIWTIGAVVVPVMPQCNGSEISNALSHSGAQVVLTLPALAARMREARRGPGALKHELCFGESDEPGTSNILPDLVQAPVVDVPVDRSAGDMAMLLYTSGTSGKPKGVVMTHGNIAAAVESANALNPDLPRRPMLHALPLAHSFGLVMLKLANRWGLTSVLLRQFDPVAVLRAIEQHQIGYLPVVPAMLVYMLHHPERAGFNVSSLYRITSGGAPLPEKLRRDFQETFGCRVDQGYGMSETFAIAAAYDDHEAYRAGSTGRAEPGIGIRVVNDRNQTLPPRCAGEICLAGANITPGYWRDPAATREAFTGEWFHTGDVGHVDEDGYLHITDRKKDLIIKGGENISPREIEEALYLHPAVADAAVVGVPDAVFGEEICAVIQRKPGIDLNDEDIRCHVAQHLCKFKVPRRIVFQDGLPKNSVGKIQKRTIREQLLVEAAA